MSIVLTGTQQWTNSYSLTGNTTFTAMARVNINPAFATSTFDIITQWQTGTRQAFRLLYSNGKFIATAGHVFYILFIFPVYGEINVTDPNNSSTDRWYHIAVTWVNRTLTLYVNGESVGVASHNNTTLPAESFTLGAVRTGNSSFTNYVQGEVRDVRLYSTALHPNVIQTISTLEEYDVIHDNIISRWPFFGPPGSIMSEITDSSGAIEPFPTNNNITYG